MIFSTCFFMNELKRQSTKLDHKLEMMVGKILVLLCNCVWNLKHYFPYWGEMWEIRSCEGGVVWKQRVLSIEKHLKSQVRPVMTFKHRWPFCHIYSVSWYQWLVGKHDFNDNYCRQMHFVLPYPCRCGIAIILNFVVSDKVFTKLDKPILRAVSHL